MTGTHDLPLDERVEVSPGVTVERRSLFGLALGGLALGGARRDDLAAFLAGAKEHLARPEDTADAELRYLYALAARAAGLTGVPTPTFRPTAQGTGVGIGVHPPNGAPFVALHWRMEPGAVIRTHPHTYGHVVTVPIAGAARVRNYELISSPPDFEAEGPFDVRLTCEQLLTPGGAMNVVPLHRGYCHGFEAGPDGAEGLDLTTRVREKRETPYLELGERRVGFDAVWSARWNT